MDKKRVPVKKVEVMDNLLAVGKQLQSMCMMDTELKMLGQKAFISYLRSVNLLQGNVLKELPLQKFALSYGLISAPKIKFFKESEPVEKVTKSSTKPEKIDLNLPEEHDESDDELLQVTSKPIEVTNEPVIRDPPKKKKKKKLALPSGHKIIFDDEGQVN